MRAGPMSLSACPFAKDVLPNGRRRANADDPAGCTTSHAPSNSRGLSTWNSTKRLTILLPRSGEYFTGSVRVICCSKRRSRLGQWRLCHLRALCAQQLAHASARSDPVSLRAAASCRVGVARSGLFGRAMSFGAARREALARRLNGHGNEHIAIQEELNGKVVDWLERVTDEQYRAAPSAE